MSQLSQARHRHDTKLPGTMRGAAQTIYAGITQPGGAGLAALLPGKVNKRIEMGFHHPPDDLSPCHAIIILRLS